MRMNVPPRQLLADRKYEIQRKIHKIIISQILRNVVKQITQYKREENTSNSPAPQHPL